MGKKIQCIGRYVMDGRTLGKGNFARVELATHGVTGCKVAIKIMDTRKIKDGYMRENLHREARILGQLRHPNIVRLYETLKATTLYCLVLECASGGDLQAYIKSYKDCYLPEEKARPFMRQLISAIHYLHEKGVSHRDLKMENIMLDEKKKNIKIVDFGLSNTFSKDNLMKTHCGSLEYAAPELIQTDENYGPEVDVWSLGIILYAMVVGKLPFTTPYTDQYRKQKLQRQIEKGLSERHEKEMTHLSSVCKDLLNKLIEPVPDMRLPLMDCEIHQWITACTKLPFYPFHNFPKDKVMKSQVIDELSEMMDMCRERIEETVHECKCDELSAMFNMMIDNKRNEKGVFDVDFTSQIEKKPEPRHRHKRKTHKKHEKEIKATVYSETPPTTEHNYEASGSEQHSANSTKSAHHEPAKTSTSFDFMALCSTPSWLGPERRRSRRRRPALTPASTNPTDLTRLSTDTIGSHTENPNLLSPNPAAALNPPNRRSLRRRSTRKRRSISCGPAHRRTTSLKEKLLGASSSQPNSPTNLNNPLIQIDPPRPTPVPRPDKLGVIECYTASPVMLQVPTNRSVSYSNVNGPVSHVDNLNANSDTSNPCSATDFNDSCPGSADTNSASHLEFSHMWPESSLDREAFFVKTPLEKISERTKQKWSESKQDSVEARIACADIKAIVRPKQAIKNKIKPKEFTKDSLFLLPPMDSDHVINSSSGSLDNFSSAMQSSNYDTSCVQCNRLLVPDPGDVILDSGDEMYKSVHVVGSSEVSGACAVSVGVGGGDGGYSDVESGDDHTDSTTALLGATRQNIGKKPVTEIKTVCDLTLDLNSSSKKNESICIGPSLDYKVPVPHNGPKNIAYETKENNAVKTLSDHRLSLEDFSPADSEISRRSSCSLYKNIIPSTPNRQMFHMPLARIESFHSDDFDALATDLDFNRKSSNSTSQTPSGSVNTPTLPCFAYKLHLHKKKSVKLKNNKENNSIECNTYALEERRRLAKEIESRVDPSGSDLLLSSGSDGGERGSNLDDSCDKIISSSRAKIHPMERDDQDSTDLMIRGSKITKSITKNKCIAESTGNDIKSSKKQNSIEKSKTSTSEGKKNTIKCSPWKHGFVQFLRKKKQGQGYRTVSHNNNDSLSVNHHSHPSTAGTTRNGHTATSYTRSLLSSQGEDNGGEMETQFSNSPIPAYSDGLEIRSSPLPGHSPSPSTTKVFDFTVITAESPQAKSCLLSWKGCRECTFSDDQMSDDAGSERTFRLEQSVDVAIKTSMAINSMKDAKTYNAYKYAHT